MLIRLQIENLALIERAELEPSAGLNVLTGETGAGKTILAQAIGLLAGAQPAPGLVGPHGNEAYVEAEFEVPEGFLDDPELEPVAALRPEGEETLVVARRLSRAGRSRALVWGRSCARADLAQLGERLLEVSSQHEARRLARPSHQLELLDAAAGHDDLLGQMAKAWAALRAARDAVRQAREDAREAALRRDELEELVRRLDTLDGEDVDPEALASERAVLRHVEELTAGIAGAAELLSPEEGEGAVVMSASAADLVAGGAQFDRALEPLAAELRELVVRLQEVASDLRARLEGVAADPGRLEVVEQRLLEIAEVERRFEAPLPDLLERAVQAREALELLEGGADRLAALEAEQERALSEAEAAAAALSASRQAAAAPFGRSVEAELAQLGMEGARLEARFEDAELGARGADAVTLVLAANAGLDPGPLAAVASGGELSRIALAIRIAARADGGPGLLLLDEVDAGVGGRTARAVGGALARLAAGAQLLVITHLPQIAQLADTHFQVAKETGDPAVTTIRRLEGDEIASELARMLGGEDDEAAVEHARSLVAGTPDHP
jgi:DNA repair protein RecN (Recombination protein N)